MYAEKKEISIEVIVSPKIVVSDIVVFERIKKKEWNKLAVFFQTAYQFLIWATSITA